MSMLEVDQQKLISTTGNIQASAAETDGGTDAGSDAGGIGNQKRCSGSRYIGAYIMQNKKEEKLDI